MDEEMLRKSIETSIEEYNKYRSPEAKARLVSNDENSFEIEFTGTFCHTCGFYDYFEDYTVTLEEYGLKTNISEINETDEGAIVTFRFSQQRIS